jgi:tetratricopeptide (TPR) repeat protein
VFQTAGEGRSDMSVKSTWTGRLIGGLGALLAVAVIIAGGWWYLTHRPVTSLEKGREAYSKRNWQVAWNSALEHLRTDPTNLEALLLSARSTARLERDDLAQSVYDSQVGMERMEGEDFYLLASGLIRQNKIGTARVSLEHGLKNCAPYPELIQELARLEAQKDNLARAVELATQLAAMPGWAARGELLSGILCTELADFKSAEAHLLKAMSLDPSLKGAPATPASVKKMLARVELQLGKPERAREILDELDKDPTDREREFLLSRAYLLERKTTEAAAALGRSNGFHDESTGSKEPSPFVGAAKCAECHAAIHKSQQNSLHSKTYVASKDMIKVALPGQPLADPHNREVKHVIVREGDRVKSEATIGDRTYKALVEFAVGSGDRGMTMVGRDEKGAMRELRMSRYHDSAGWDKTTGHPPQPGDASGWLGEILPPDAVRRCLGCHTTDPHSAATLEGPAAHDRAIGCEKCHGPGGAHVAAAETKFTDLAIARPQLFSAERVIQLCGQCHSPRGATLAELGNDKSNVRFQGATLVQSRCYTESNGALSCITCHNPHRDAETSASHYERKCLACHSTPKLQSAIPVPGQAPMCPVNPKTDCVKCHMPVVKDAVPHSPFSDHHIRVHREPTKTP